MAHPIRLAPPQAEGLYDPRYEHDACGVGFVVNIKGRTLARRRRARARGAHQPPAPRGVRQRSQHGRRRRHPHSAAGSIPPQGRQCPRHRPAAGRASTAWATCSCRATTANGHSCGRSSSRSSPRKARRSSAGAPVPTTTAHAGRGRGGHDAGHRAAVCRLSRRRGGQTLGASRSAAVRAEAVRHPQAHRARGRPAGAHRAPDVLHPEPLVEDAHLQRDAHGRSDPADVSRSDRSRRRVGARARAPALQHQHLPVVAAGAPVPLHRAQRRDQHAARQHQLDARARRPAPVRRVRRRSEEDPADHPRRRQRHGDVRQRPRVHLHGGALAAARHPDDDPGAVVRARDA